MTTRALEFQVLTKIRRHVFISAVTFWGLEFPVLLIFTSVCDFIHNASGVGALKTE
jgi:hypothetical protein